jgi:hypothetical protein
LGEVLGLVTPGRLIAPENGFKLGYELLLLRGQFFEQLLLCKP